MVFQFLELLPQEHFCQRIFLHKHSSTQNIIYHICSGSSMRKGFVFRVCSRFLFCLLYGNWLAEKCELFSLLFANIGSSTVSFGFSSRYLPLSIRSTVKLCTKSQLSFDSCTGKITTLPNSKSVGLCLVAYSAITFVCFI